MNFSNTDHPKPLLTTISEKDPMTQKFLTLIALLVHSSVFATSQPIQVNWIEDTAQGAVQGITIHAPCQQKLCEDLPKLRATIAKDFQIENTKPITASRFLKQIDLFMHPPTDNTNLLMHTSNMENMTEGKLYLVPRRTTAYSNSDSRKLLITEPGYYTLTIENTEKNREEKPVSIRVKVSNGHVYALN